MYRASSSSRSFSSRPRNIKPASATGNDLQRHFRQDVAQRRHTMGSLRPVITSLNKSVSDRPCRRIDSAPSHLKRTSDGKLKWANHADAVRDRPRLVEHGSIACHSTALTSPVFFAVAVLKKARRDFVANTNPEKLGCFPEIGDDGSLLNAKMKPGD